MKMENKRVVLNITILLSLFFIGESDTYDDNSKCVYTVYVRTGSILKAGTDSKINLEFWNNDGHGIRITNVEKWGGLMGQNYDYFERGNLDVFSGKGPCLNNGPICAMKVVSDGSGSYHGWYCGSVEVTVTGPSKGCAQRAFEVEQWLATDTYPYNLTTVRDKCEYDLPKNRRPVEYLSNLGSTFSS